MKQENYQKQMIISLTLTGLTAPSGMVNTKNRKQTTMPHEYLHIGKNLPEEVKQREIFAQCTEMFAQCMEIPGPCTEIVAQCMEIPAQHTEMPAKRMEKAAQCSETPVKYCETAALHYEITAQRMESSIPGHILKSNLNSYEPVSN